MNDCAPISHFLSYSARIRVCVQQTHYCMHLHVVNVKSDVTLVGEATPPRNKT